MRHILNTILFTLASLATVAQNIEMRGSIKERIDKFDKKGNIKENDFDVRDISGVSVIITSNGEKIKSTTTDAQGNYSIRFSAAGAVYHLELRKEGYIPKISELDLRKLMLSEELLLEDWDFGMRKDISNLSSVKLVEKPFERYYYDSKKGQLLYDNQYALEYQDEYTEVVVAQVEEVHKATSDHNDPNKQLERAQQILADAERKAAALLLQAENRGEQLAHAIQNQARIDAGKYTSKDRPKTYTSSEESTKINRGQLYTQIRDSLLQQAAQSTKTGKKETINTDNRQLEDKKLQLFAQKQQLEIDRLKAITREDSLIIKLREQEINTAELEIHKIESQIVHAENEVARKQQELMLKEAENKNQKNILVMVSLMTLLVVAVAGFIYNSNKRNRRIAEILRNQNEVIALKNESILSSIKYAKRIQDAILPQKAFMHKVLPHSFVLYMPKDIVSGDFYWVHQVSEDETLFAAVDCTGHGVPGAFMSIVGYHSLHMAVNETGLTRPAAILDAMNTSVNMILRQGFGDKAVKDGMDVSLCLLNRKKRTLEYAGAYNPLWIIRDGELLETKADKQAVGTFIGQTIPFTNHEIELKIGDFVYIFSDGYMDQFGGPEGKKIMSRGLKQLLVQHHTEKLSGQKIALKKHLYEWMNEGEEDQVDDVCIIGVHIT